MLKERVAEESLRNGHQPFVRDLYLMNFNPVLTPADLEQLKSGRTPDDILQEQQLISKSELITLIFPLWWAGYPAIIKGYIDRVLSYGFAYKSGPNGVQGLLKGKKVFLFTSMGNTVEEYEEKNLIDAFKQTLGTEIFQFCGMEIVHHQFFPQIPDASEEKKRWHVEKALEAFQSVFVNTTTLKNR